MIYGEVPILMQKTGAKEINPKVLIFGMQEAPLCILLQKKLDQCGLGMLVEKKHHL